MRACVGHDTNDGPVEVHVDCPKQETIHPLLHKRTLRCIPCSFKQRTFETRRASRRHREKKKGVNHGRS